MYRRRAKNLIAIFLSLMQRDKENICGINFNNDEKDSL